MEKPKIQIQCDEIGGDFFKEILQGGPLAYTVLSVKPKGSKTKVCVVTVISADPNDFFNLGVRYANFLNQH